MTEKIGAVIKVSSCVMSQVTQNNQLLKTVKGGHPIGVHLPSSNIFSFSRGKFSRNDPKVDRIFNFRYNQDQILFSETKEKMTQQQKDLLLTQPEYPKKINSYLYEFYDETTVNAISQVIDKTRFLYQFQYQRLFSKFLNENKQLNYFDCHYKTFNYLTLNTGLYDYYFRMANIDFDKFFTKPKSQFFIE